MKINEMFYSFQGEGRNQGRPTYFIRTNGCNLKCLFCDTKYANNAVYFTKTPEEIASLCKLYKNITFTGGEPLLQKDLGRTLALIDANLEVETNGTIYRSELIGFAHFNVSPKLDFLNKKYIESLKKWSHQADFKFVIRNRRDFNKAKALSDDLGLENVILMPEGVDPVMQLAETQGLIKLCKVYWQNAQVIPRLHILLYGNKRGV